MQSVSSKIWTRIAVSISYDDNHYPTVIKEGFLLTNYAGILVYHYAFYFLIIWFHASTVLLYYILFCFFRFHLINGLVLGFGKFSVLWDLFVGISGLSSKNFTISN